MVWVVELGRNGVTSQDKDGDAGDVTSHELQAKMTIRPVTHTHTHQLQAKMKIRPDHHEDTDQTIMQTLIRVWDEFCDYSATLVQRCEWGSPTRPWYMDDIVNMGFPN